MIAWNFQSIQIQCFDSVGMQVKHVYVFEKHVYQVDFTNIQEATDRYTSKKSLLSVHIRNHLEVNKISHVLVKTGQVTVRTHLNGFLCVLVAHDCL